MWTGYRSLTTLHVPDYLLFRSGYDTSDIRRLWPRSIISLGIVPWQSGYLNTVLLLEELLECRYYFKDLTAVFINEPPDFEDDRCRALAESFQNVGVVCRNDPDAFAPCNARVICPL